jgi:hypothetical protein
MIRKKTNSIRELIYENLSGSVFRNLEKKMLARPKYILFLKF